MCHSAQGSEQRHKVDKVGQSVRTGRAILFVVSLFAIVYGVSALATRTSQHIWGDDWAQYVNHARSIAEGRAYSDTGYMFNPHRPNIGPAMYPPATALLFAPLMADGKVDVRALKFVPVLCMSLSVLLVFLLFRSTSATAGAATAALFALHPATWTFANYLVSEAPYIFFSLAALLAARLPQRPGSPWHADLPGGITTGLLVYAATATRSIGVTLLAAIILHAIVTGRWRRPWPWIVLAVAAGSMLLQARLLGSADYSSEIAQRSVARVFSNLHGYWGATGQLLPLPGRLSTVVPVLAGILIASGVWAVLSIHGKIAGARVWILAGRMPVEIWYLACYLGALVVLPFAPHWRYLLPLLPIMLAYGAIGFGQLVGKLSAGAAHSARIGVVLVLGAWGAWMWTREPPVEPDSGALCTECLALYSAVRQFVPAGEPVAFAKPRALALLARRPSWIWAADQEAAQTWAEFASAGVSWFVTVRPTHELAPLYPEYLAWDGWRTRPGATLIYGNSDFRLVRLAPSAVASIR